MRSFKARGLGRGLSALLNDNTDHIVSSVYENSETADNINMLDIHQLVVNSFQPRKTFDQESLLELADSIKVHGIIQPIIVNKTTEVDKYMIIAGERRWRAAKLANLIVVPAVIKDLSDKQILEIALIENIQRESLNVIEEAEGYKRLIEEFGFTQDGLSNVLGKSRSHIANYLRLNNLSDEVKDNVINCKITMGHARSLAALNHQTANKAVKVIINKNLNVRQTEKYIKQLNDNVNKHGISTHLQPRDESHDLQLLAEYLVEKLATKVVIDSVNNTGKITIFFSSLEKLDEILSKID